MHTTQAIGVFQGSRETLGGDIKFVVAASFQRPRVKLFRPVARSRKTSTVHPDQLRARKQGSIVKRSASLATAQGIPSQVFCAPTLDGRMQKLMLACGFLSRILDFGTRAGSRETKRILFRDLPCETFGGCKRGRLDAGAFGILRSRVSKLSMVRR
jgi:hypothetical protein